MTLELIENSINLPACDIIGAYKDMTEADWLQHRTTGLGGSDAGGVLGLSKYSSPLAVWMDKTGRSIPDDLSDNEFVQMGNLLEPFIRRELVAPYIKEKMGFEVEVIDPTHMYRSKKIPFIIINTDGFLRVQTGKWRHTHNNLDPVNPHVSIDKLVGLEIKTGNSYVLPQWGGVDGDELPDSYYAQVQHYMAGTGLDEFWVFGLIGNQRLLRIVPRNELFIADMIEKEAAFWELVKLNDPLYAPLPTGSDADMKALFELGNPQEETTVDLSDMKQELNRLEFYTFEIKQLEIKKKLEQQKILMALGQSKYGETEEFEVTYSRFERSSFDKTKFMKDHPGMLDPYITFSESGRLSVKNI